MTDVEEMGPIDYALIEFPGGNLTGEAAPHLLRLVESGIIRLLDLIIVQKNDDGTFSGLEIADLGLADDHEFMVFDGVSSGLLGEEDVAAASEAMEPGAVAALLVWENSWAAPFAMALRRSGGQLIDSGRIPVQAILAALDEIEDDA